MRLKRADGAFGHPFEAVKERKREKIRKVALSFFKKLRKEPLARFDVLSMRFEGGEENIEI